MLLHVGPERVETAPLGPRVPAGAAGKAALAGQPEAVADWVVASLKRQVYNRVKDEKRASRYLSKLFARVNLVVEFR